MLKRVLSTSFHSVMSRFFATATNLFIIYFISRKMGQTELGNYGIVFFFFIFFSSISSLNLNLFFGKELAKFEKKSDEEKAIINGLVVVTLLGALLTAALPFLIFLIYKKVGFTLLMISSIAGYFFGIERNLGGFLLGREKMALESITNLIAFLLVVLPMVLKSGLFLSIENIFILRAISMIIAVIIKLWYFRENFRGLQFRIRLDFFTEGKYYWFTGFSSVLMRELDVLILSFFIDRSLLGAYFLSLRIYFSFGIISEVLAYAMTPFISRTYNGKESRGFREFNMKMMSVIIGLAALSSIVLLFGREFFVSIFSRELVGSSGKYLFYLSFMLFFRFFSFFTGMILTSTEFQKVRFYIAIVFSSLMVLLNVILAPMFQINGVIFSRAVVEVGMFFVLGYYVKKLLRHYGRA